jgi:hypothetical protein
MSEKLSDTLELANVTDEVPRAYYAYSGDDDLIDRIRALEAELTEARKPFKPTTYMRDLEMRLTKDGVGVHLVGQVMGEMKGRMSLYRLEKGKAASLRARLAALEPVSVEEACRRMHEAYERHAATLGWETQKLSRVRRWDDVPDANKETMRATIREVFTGLHIDNTTPEVEGDE